ncbi:MAG: hypothetical protein JOS17DRAFT_414349 [Linnemannia elongata]|nr:MAG: hypothetical protein JOS17DRAFT_414349 [Linnemannia elongata]
MTPAPEESLCATTFTFDGCYWVCGSSADAAGGGVGMAAGMAGGKHALETGHGGGAGVACWGSDGTTTEKWHYGLLCLSLLFVLGVVVCVKDVEIELWELLKIMKTRRRGNPFHLLYETKKYEVVAIIFQWGVSLAHHGRVIQGRIERYTLAYTSPLFVSSTKHRLNDTRYLEFHPSSSLTSSCCNSTTFHDPIDEIPWVQ